ncbi:MAG: hypothetical protein HFE28_01495 [Clostridia bacterium]|jgi:hypothetical protein|nr:hypothetical protein [Clostridia bacterium]
MLQKLNAEETLEYLIGVMKENLNELYGELPAGSNRHFIHGEKTAYVECLEIVQLWNQAAEHGLEGVLEKQYPV